MISIPTQYAWTSFIPDTWQQKLNTNFQLSVVISIKAQMSSPPLSFLTLGVCVCFISCRNGQKSFSTWRPTSWCRTCPERRASKKRTSPDACTRAHTYTRKQSRTKCKSTVPKIDMKIGSASTRNVTHSRSHIRDLMYFTWTKMVKCYVKILRNHHVAFTPSPKHICAYIVHTLQSTTQPELHFSHINGGSKNRRKQDYQNSWKYVYTSL